MDDSDRDDGPVALVVDNDRGSRLIACALLEESGFIGVETEDQLAFLRDHGCDVVQGYIVSPALCGEEMKEYLERKGTELTTWATRFTRPLAGTQVRCG